MCELCVKKVVCTMQHPFGNFSCIWKPGAECICTLHSMKLTFCLDQVFLLLAERNCILANVAYDFPKLLIYTISIIFKWNSYSKVILEKYSDNLYILKNKK